MEHAPMIINDVPRECDADARNFPRDRLTVPTQMGQGCLRHPFAGVPNLPEHIPLSRVAYVDNHRMAPGRSTNGIVQQLVERL
jgi:hypothetical protein